LPGSGSIGIGDPDVDGVDGEALKKLCEPTGGRAFVPKYVEDLDEAFQQLERELRQQYLVAYEPANAAADGKFRKIEVRISNRKDIRVRHRRGYYAPGT
jgi:Ca-activated chloride channel homolog